MSLTKKWARHMGKSDILFGDEWAKYGRDKPWEPNPDDYQWDPETGMPIGLTRMPEGGSALRFQQRSNEIVARRNASLRRQAMAYLEMGQRSMAAFRPGGYANDSYFREMSATAMNSQITAPDLMSGDRAFAMNQAAQMQEEAAGRSKVMNVVSLIASLYTGGAAGGALYSVSRPQQQEGSLITAPGSQPRQSGVDVKRDWTAPRYE